MICVKCKNKTTTAKCSISQCGEYNSVILNVTFTGIYVNKCSMCNQKYLNAMDLRNISEFSLALFRGIPPNDMPEIIDFNEVSGQVKLFLPNNIHKIMTLHIDKGSGVAWKITAADLKELLITP